MSTQKQAELNIQTFLRIRPSKKASGYFRIDETESGSIHVNLPENFKSEYIDNSKLNHVFHFNDIISMQDNQEIVFKKVGLSAVENALEGFNSTIFAYGQTGSGKTFTLTGGPERYADRGIIPRAISMLFQEFRKRTDTQYKVFISYLEIYNEQGYDLLDPSHESKALEDLTKVKMLEDEYGNFHLKNLSMHAADTEEDALNLLFLGDTNRAIAETPMNMASSRSHCIFSISMEARETGTDKLRRSKLNLVDLAGSERIGKTNSTGSILKEAKYINSSLFYLEVVISALYEKSTIGRTHIPYRNSMMTSVLRDSLGGNCKTIMIATINPEGGQTDESLSTCRFAQRVSLIKNRASVNEDVDPSLVIKRLKSETLNLRDEIAFLKGESGDGDELTPKEVEDLKNQVRMYSEDGDPHSILSIGTLTLTKIKMAFSALKELVVEARSRISESSASNDAGAGSGSAPEQRDKLKYIQELKACLLQRDNEIAILVNMVKRGKTAEDVLAVSGVIGSQERLGSDDRTASASSQAISSAAASSVNRGSYDRERKQQREDEEKMSKEVDAKYRRQHQQHSGSAGFPTHPQIAIVRDDKENQLRQQQEHQQRIIKRHLFGVPPPSDAAVLEDSAASFEWFRERCSLNAAIEENREILRLKISEAKSLGERANQSRTTISYLKNSVEAIRRERALQRFDRGEGKAGEGDDDGNGEVNEEEIEEETAEEKTHRRAIEQEKVVYKESFEKLRMLKPEIEHIRKILDKCRSNLQQQFDQWFSNLHSKHMDVFGAGGFEVVGPCEVQESVHSNQPPLLGSHNGGSSDRSSVSHSSFEQQQQQQDRSPSSASYTQSTVRMPPRSKVVPERAPGPSLYPSAVASAGDVNEDIAAFYQAKEVLLKMKRQER